MKIITVGRKEDNDEVIGNDPFVGRHHCQFVEKDGQYFVVDLDSTNGTFVNSKRITGQYRLDDSDVVRIGNTVLQWKRYFDKKHFKTQFVDSGSSITNAPTPIPPVKVAEQTNSQTPTPIMPPSSENTNTPAPRHGFITFWLWMMVICNFFAGIPYIFLPLDEYYLYSTNGSVYIDSSVFVILGLILWISVVGSISLLRRKKWGFYMIIGLSFISNCIVFFEMSSETGVIGLLVSALCAWLLWVILHIKKEGVKYWDTMA